MMTIAAPPRAALPSFQAVFGSSTLISPSAPLMEEAQWRQAAPQIQTNHFGHHSMSQYPSQYQHPPHHRRQGSTGSVNSGTSSASTMIHPGSHVMVASPLNGGVPPRPALYFHSTNGYFGAAQHQLSYQGHSHSAASTPRSPHLSVSSASSTNTNGGKTGRWSKDEQELFFQGIKLHGRNWKKIGAMIPTRTLVQIRTHAQKVLPKIDTESADDTSSCSSECGTPSSHRNTQNKRKRDQPFQSEAMSEDGCASPPKMPQRKAGWDMSSLLAGPAPNSSASSQQEANIGNNNTQRSNESQGPSPSPQGPFQLLSALAAIAAEH